MDPHSRLSQYNHRPPKTGPHLQGLRQMESKTMAVFEHFRKSSSASSFSTFSTSSSKSNSSKELSSLASRPIATNSRVKRDEKYRRDMHLAFIDNALTQKAKGMNEHYEDLVRQFNPKTISSEGHQQTLHLRSYLTALSHVVSKLDRSHITLVDAIVGMPWTTMDLAFVNAYISFLGMLVSARPEYLTLVLEKAAQGLTYYSARKALDTGFAESSASPLTRRVVYDRIHSLLEHLVSVIPTLSSTLFPFLARNFPHKRQNQAEQVTYVRNLLRLSDYCPELWDRIFGLIVDRTIQIDVEIQVELEELEAGELDEADEVFPLDIFDTVIGQEGDDSDSDSDSEDEDDIGDLSDISSDAGSANEDFKTAKQMHMDAKRVQEMVSKLDSMLEIIFKHLDSLHSGNTATILVPSSSPDPDALDGNDLIGVSRVEGSIPKTLSQRDTLESHFHALLSIFERTILRTFKSRYTQFLIFWYSSLDNQFRDHFLGTIVSKALLEPDQPVVTRAAAASYVASYVSRALFVDSQETRNVIRILCRFLETHLDVFETRSSHSPDRETSQQSAEEHAVFYASAQAVFLIFCFRWRDLMETNEGDEDELSSAILNGRVGSHNIWLPELNVMQRVVNSSLNPLKVCSSAVVQQFAHVAQHVGFIYCFSIIETNKRSEYSPNSGEKTNQPAVCPPNASQSFDADLTTFFPFDPYKLPKSCSYIEGIYRDWTSVAIDDSDDEDEGDNEPEEDEIGNVLGLASYRQHVEEDQRMHGPASFVDDTGALGKSFGGMSISPIRTRIPEALSS